MLIQTLPVVFGGSAALAAEGVKKMGMATKHHARKFT